MPRVQNGKQTVALRSRFKLRFLDLEFICILVRAICCFRPIRCASIPISGDLYWFVGLYV